MVRDIGNVFFEFLRELANMLLPTSESLHNPQPVFITKRFEPFRAKLGGKSGRLR